MSNLLSASALAKKYGVLKSEIDTALEKHDYIKKEGKSWRITKKGIKAGGVLKSSARYGEYLAWPETLKLSIDQAQNKNEVKSPGGLISSTVIGQHFSISANKINFLLSELGWIKKGSVAGWKVTRQGKKQGGHQSENRKSGVPYVRWPESILTSKVLKESIGHFRGEPSVESTTETQKPEFREKFEAKHRATDGHFVRSRAEMLIDNWLYMAEIVHAYERKLPIEEDVYSDFYIPTGKVYIEFWGYEDDPKYSARKKAKLAIYDKYGFNLIELNDKDVLNLDDKLPAHLLKYGVKSY